MRAFLNTRRKTGDRGLPFGAKIDSSQRERARSALTQTFVDKVREDTRAGARQQYRDNNHVAIYKKVQEGGAPVLEGLMIPKRLWPVLDSPKFVMPPLIALGLMPEPQAQNYNK
ncbi:hypothetical protein DFH27DRAFT_616074 [Peziza echinospora]|nr:hypothetical protein DFH27DRAFT_616074 [Peziza echinospora]